MSESSGIPNSTADDAAYRLYDLATGDDDARLCRDIPDEQCQEQPRNFVYQVAAQALSKTGDALADSKVVLPWLLGMVGAPAFLMGLLVPIRESLALLPQVFIGGFIRHFPVRKGFWVIGSVVEGACVILMGGVAALGIRGVAAGWIIVGLLVVFSLARGVASIAAKDTLGKTVSKGRRGRVTGYAATISGVVAAIVGLFLALGPDGSRPAWLLYAIVAAAGFSWFMAAIAFARVREYPGATAGGMSIQSLVKEQVFLLLRDKELQKFLTARSLMVSTALASPVYVGLAQRETGQSLDNLGWLIISVGLAGAVSSSVWGVFSDRSSRLTMAVAALTAGALGLVVVATLRLVPDLADNITFYTIILFVLGIAHAGVRIGRKTHIVDLGTGDRKSEYVALSNTLIGLVLIVLGGAISVILGFGFEVALIVLSVMAMAGAAASLAMKHVQGDG